jgi:hypothetical protein
MMETTTTWRPTRAASSLLVMLSAFLAIGVLGTTLYGVARFYSPVPYLDEWDAYVGIFRAIVEGEYPVWWAQHVDHRIVTTRIVAWLDWRLFGGLHVFIVICQLALQTACIWILARGRGLAVYLLITAALFSWSMKEIFTWSFGVQIGFVYFFALLAHHLYRRSLPGSLACAVLATFSMANGVLVFVSLAVQAVAERRRKDLVAIGAAALVTWGIHFSHYVFGAGGAPMLDPVRIVSFVLVFFGQPLFPATQSMWLCGAIGAVMLALTGWRVIGLVKGSSGFIPGIMAFLLLSALAAAHGRGSEGLYAATASRYTMGAMILWSVCLLAWIDIAPKTSMVVALALLGCTAVSQTQVFGSRDPVYFRKLAVFETAHGLDQIDIDANLLPFHDRYMREFKWSAAHRVGVFGQPWMLDDITYNPSVRDDSRCKGFVDLRKGAAVEGWARGHGTEVILTDAQGATVGRGLIGAWRPDLVEAGMTSSNQRGWVAYAKPGSVPTDAFLVAGDRFCRIGAVK